MEKVSIVIPAYNVEKYIENVLENVISQTYSNIEIIIVNDGSIDSTSNKCRLFLSRDNRIKLIEKQNGGLSDARNVGIENATGQFLFFLDADDYISNNCIELLVNTITNSCADIAICKMVRTSEIYNSIRSEDVFDIQLYDSKAALVEMLYGFRFSTSAGGKLFRADLFKEIRFPLGKFSEDLFTIYKTFLSSKSIVYADFVGYYYYYRAEGSIVISRYSSKHLDVLDAVEQIEKELKFKDKEIRDAIASQYINVIYDIAIRYPTISEFNNKRIQNALRINRKVTFLNKRSPRRLRVFSFLSFFGNYPLLEITKVYYHNKWKSKD